MNFRPATTADIQLLAALNAQLIEDERADTSLRQSELELRMGSVPSSGRGLGRAAWSVLLRDVFPKGCRVTLEVLTHNDAGLAFCRAVGFTDHALTLKAYT